MGNLEYNIIYVVFYWFHKSDRGLRNVYQL